MCPPSRSRFVRATGASALVAAGSDIVRFDVTSRRFRAAAAGIAFAVLCGARLCPLAGTASASGVVRAGDAEPGDVARVDVSGVNGDERITGSVLGQELAFHFDEGQQKWRALVGIDLDTKPGAYRLRIGRARRRSGGDAHAADCTEGVSSAPPSRARRLRRSAGGGARADRPRQRCARRGVCTRHSEAMVRPLRAAR